MELSRSFKTSAADEYALSLDVMAAPGPGVPYWISSGGLFEVSIDGLLVDSFNAGYVGITAPKYQVDRTLTGMVRSTMG